MRLDNVHPFAVLDTPEELTRFCETHPEAETRAYWHNHSMGDPHSAHIFFLAGGGLVFGLSVAASDEGAWDRWLTDLKSFVGAEHGYWIGECPPLSTVAEFIRVTEDRR